MQGCAGSEWREGSRAEDSPGLQGNLKRKHVRCHHQGPELGGPTHRSPAGDHERLSILPARSERGLSGLPGGTQTGKGVSCLGRLRSDGGRCQKSPGEGGLKGKPPTPDEGRLPQAGDKRRQDAHHPSASRPAPRHGAPPLVRCPKDSSSLPWGAPGEEAAPARPQPSNQRGRHSTAGRSKDHSG